MQTEEPSIFEALPPEIIQSIALYVPRGTLEALRLTCRSVESAVRSQTLNFLSLRLYTETKSYAETKAQMKALALKPTPEEPQRHRNTLHARTLAIGGRLTVCTLGTASVTKSRWLFWNQTETCTFRAPRVNFDGPWPSASELDPEQPVRLLEGVLKNLDNVREVRLSLVTGKDIISPPAWEVLSSWMLSQAESLTTIRITSSNSLQVLDQVPQLVDLASRMKLNIHWDHTGSALAPILEYMDDISPKPIEDYPDTSPNTTLPRFTYLVASVGDHLNFNIHHVKYLSNLQVLNIDNDGLSIDHPAPLQQEPAASWDRFWLALADNNVRLEHITAPYSPAFKTYIQSYDSTMKTLSLRSLRESINIMCSFSELETPGFECHVMEKHFSTLEVIEIRCGNVYWEVEIVEGDCGQEWVWKYADSSVEPLLNKALSLERLYVPLLTSSSMASEHVSILLETMLERLPNLEELVIALFTRPEYGTVSSLSAKRYAHALKAIERALDDFTYNYLGDLCPPRQIIAHEYLSEDINERSRGTRVWERWVDWEKGEVYRYRPILPSL